MDLTTKDAMMERAVVALEKIKTIMSQINPAGVIQAFAGSAVPDGWLLCDGSAVSRVTYKNLFDVIGETYGGGDGSTTFNLPDLVDKFVEGSGNAGTEKNAGLPAIEGSFTVRGCQQVNALSESGVFALSTAAVSNTGANIGTGTNNGRIVSFDASKASAIYGNSTTVQPPALTMLYIIKY